MTRKKISVKPALLFFLSLLAHQFLFAQSKHALIIAIGNYPNNNGWPAISSIRDVNYIRTALLNQEFPEKNITILKDSAATLKGICNAFTGMIHSPEIKNGDIVVIHFSTHGEQLEDDNNDEIDGLDESIVSYNAISPFAGSKKDFQKNQKEYFRDDLFGAYVDSIRKKLGPGGDVIVFIDACHSGSGTRGTAKVRGGQPPLVSEDFDKTKFDNADHAGVFRETNVSEGNKNDRATYVVFSAARAEELDHETLFEGEGMGSLTFAISQVFAGKLDEGTTYRSLFSKIQSVMNEKVPGQHPVLEGDGIDRQLFGGRFVAQKPYIEIESIQGKEVIIKAGLLSGLDAGAKLSIYPSGTNDPLKANPLASGIVKEAKNYSATVMLDKDLAIKPAAGWVFITEPVYKTEPISLGIISNRSGNRGVAGGFSETEIQTIKTILKDLPLIRFDGEPELLLVKGETKDSLKIASNGFLFKTINNSSTNTALLKDLIRQYAQYKLLQGLEIKDPAADVEIRLVPVINGKADTSKIDTKLVNGIYEYNVGDKIVLWVKNSGTDPVYFNILDMQPDGIINGVLPKSSKRITPEELKIKAGNSLLLSNYIITITPPAGMEIFKIFVSKERIDMEGIANSNGAGPRGNFTVLEKLFKNSYSTASRGTETENISNKDGSVYSLLFRIVEKAK